MNVSKLLVLVQFYPMKAMKKQSIVKKLDIKRPCNLFVEKMIRKTVRFRCSLLSYRFQRVINHERESIVIENTISRNWLLSYGLSSTN